MVKGEFYKSLVNENKYSDDFQNCMERTVEHLLSEETGIEKPGMLLGKIQSGKTKAYIGIIGLAFDNGYHFVIVLTKGTIALAKQTYERLKDSFKVFIDNDSLKICDIMHLPNNFTRYELQQKLIIVVKKEVNNLRRVMHALENTYPDLKSKKLLIIDDEADYASIGFKMNRQAGLVEINKIAKQIDELRRKINSYNYLQVTATPYSLYLQPENIEIPQASFVFKPTRPAFTELLPVYAEYVGGDFYFEKSEEPSSTAYYVYEEVPVEELEALKKEDGRIFKIEDSLISPKIKILRKAIINFIVGASIRRLQQLQKGERQKKYSFIVHTEHARASHAWQDKVVHKIKVLLSKNIEENPDHLELLIKESYDDISHSLKLLGEDIPDFDITKNEVYKALGQDYLMIMKVNSESDEVQLLDERGQLYLRTPLNLFIGGQILDRGLTIKNLIGFYYGRRPQKTQQDTVLQHSRMYGDRPREDLAVTRFYTARRIYESMRKIHEFDCALREAFERGAQDSGVVFIHKDTQNRIVPCSPNKILLSTTTTLRPHKRILPIGFQTDYKTHIQSIVDDINKFILPFQDDDPKKPFLISVDDAEKIIDNIAKTLNFPVGQEWDIKAFKSSIEYLSKITEDPLKGKVWCIVRKGRNIARFKHDRAGFKQDGVFSDAPDTPQDEGTVSKNIAINIPALVLIQQNGKEELGWRGAPFWWPILVVPKNVRTVIFASDLIDVQPETIV